MEKKRAIGCVRPLQPGSCRGHTAVAVRIVPGVGQTLVSTTRQLNVPTQNDASTRASTPDTQSTATTCSCVQPKHAAYTRDHGDKTMCEVTSGHGRDGRNATMVVREGQPTNKRPLPPPQNNHEIKMRPHRMLLARSAQVFGVGCAPEGNAKTANSSRPRCYVQYTSSGIPRQLDVSIGRCT